MNCTQHNLSMLSAIGDLIGDEKTISMVQMSVEIAFLSKAVMFPDGDHAIIAHCSACT